jgi:hypothetical protein
MLDFKANLTSASVYFYLPKFILPITNKDIIVTSN